MPKIAKQQASIAILEQASKEEWDRRQHEIQAKIEALG